MKLELDLKMEPPFKLKEDFKVLVCVNTLDRVSSFIYQNHIAFAAYFAKRFPKAKMFWFSPHRQTIDTARNTAAIDALKLECDYLMFIDDDVLISPNTFDILVEADKDIIAGLVYLRGYPFHVMAFREMKEKVKDATGNIIDDPRFQLTYYDEIHQLVAQGEKLIKCAAVGFSCCLIKCDVIQALEPPYFCTGPLNTEDVYFCLKTKNLTPEPEIYIHTDVRPGHLLNPEPIEYDTKLLLTNFYDNLAYKFKDIAGLVDNEGKDIQYNPRNLNYIERNIKRL